jgi:hypothetical protein
MLAYLGEFSNMVDLWAILWLLVSMMLGGRLKKNMGMI